MRTIIALSIVVFFFSCSNKRKLPEGILEPQKMQSVFWDFIRADVYAKDFLKKDSSRNDTTENIMLQNKIFSFYKISRKSFYKSYDYYTSHPDLMNVLMDSMLAKQNRLRLQPQLRKSKDRLAPGERNEIVPGKKIIVSDDSLNAIMPVNKTNNIPFGKKKIMPPRKIEKKD